MTRLENILLPLIFALMTCLPAVAVAAPIHDASRNGDVAEVKRLLSSGADVEARDKYGQTPLHLAYDREKLGVVLVLEAWRVEE